MFFTASKFFFQERMFDIFKKNVKMPFNDANGENWLHILYSQDYFV